MDLLILGDFIAHDGEEMMLQIRQLMAEFLQL
jgi:hypothetical protein